MTPFTSHMAKDGSTVTLCGEPWQGWQEPDDADPRASGNPVPPFEKPPEAPVRQCQACLSRLKEGWPS